MTERKVCIRPFRARLTLCGREKPFDRAFPTVELALKRIADGAPVRVCPGCAAVFLARRTTSHKRKI